jgi:HSP20 family protein
MLEVEKMNISDLVPWKSNRGSEVAVRQENSPATVYDEFNRLFDDFFENSWMTPWSERFGTRFNEFTPRVNVTEREKELEVTAELPGMAENDIDITLAHDTLTIKGEKKQETEDKGDNYYRMERSYGKFSRVIPLPADVVDNDSVEATFKNGVLTIILPKLEEAQQVSRRITVNAG